MKIVLIITDFGSFNNFLSELAITLSTNPKIELHVICSKQKVIDIIDKSDFSRIQFHFVSINRTVSVFGTINSAIKINSILKKVKPEIVHAHFTTGIFPSILFRLKGIKYFGTFHGLGLNSSKGITKLIFLMVESFCFMRLDRIFLVNKKDENYLANTLFRDKSEKYSCFGFGCDLSLYNISNYDLTTKIELKNQIGIENQIILAFTGRFVFFKGFHIVVKIFNELDKRYPGRFHLLLIGDRDPRHESGLNKEEERLLYSNKSITKLGYVDNVNEYLSIVDIFLFPSKKEGCPTCVMEALAMGIPTICSDSRGNSDLVTNNENGFLINDSEVSEFEITQFIERILGLTENKKLYRRISENAINERAKYSRNSFVKEQIDLYLISKAS